MRYRWIVNEQYIVEVVRSITDRDIPPSADEMEDVGEIVSMRRAVEAPFLKIPPHMAYNGHHLRRANVRDILEASAVEQEAFNLPVSERGPLYQEITKIKGE
jgi:hypothetical protein